MGFLPDDYEPPRSGGAYFKPQQGENKIRILAKPVLGNVAWTSQDGKRVPIRKPLGEIFDTAKIDEAPKHFWALPIYDYADKTVKVWEITQATIREHLEKLNSDKDWGDPTQYGLKVTKEGEKMDTKYNVIPAPKSELPKEIKEQWEDTPVDLTALFRNEDPFTPNSPAAVEEEEEDDIPF